MIFLLTTIIWLSYESKIHLSKWLNIVLTAGLIVTIIAIGFLSINGLCNMLIAILDLSATLTILIIFLKRLNSK